ncbi:hypothetical protein M2T70_16865 [Elizabethkingia anophelis]|uniref:hypothetical protein n=1 Tax=Elizabethkingia anophelis TaxID=1117645 RepID=UPI0011162CE7|nr:hypothetical protein [Elizabethkingia anophelis]MCL1650635.1 hypothetical protein [Elizabethkingia anophelis]MCL1684689.1 hypothetical protein [Elizabethkingia anophelis]
MKRNLLVRSFYGLLLILLVSVVIVSCIHDEREAVSSNNSINISQDITTKAYTKLSPWSEDVDFIQKVQKVFLKNAKLDYFRDKYGDIYWDYALSFPNKLEAGLALPIIKDNNVVMLLKATEKNERIYFQKIENGEYIDFFRNLILQDKSLQTYTNGAENSIRKVAGIDKMATMEYKCTYKTVSIGCPNGQTDCPPLSKTVSECSWIETGGQDFESIAPPSESGGGGGDGGYSGDGELRWMPDVLLFSKKPAGEKIPNIKDYLKCLNLSQGATVTLYVDQPTPNTTSTWSGSVADPNVGHTFISITQGGTTRFMGFYPSNSISPFSSPPAAVGMYVNDQGHKFSVSITSNITATQLNNIVGYINSMSSATYNLNTYNCTNFGIDALAKAGISLPKTSGNWPGGGGSNPGNLGQDLRNLNNSSVQKNTSGGNAPKNTGSCN